MNLIDKIKDYVNSKNEVVDETENIQALYQTIMEELNQYK